MKKRGNELFNSIIFLLRKKQYEDILFLYSLNHKTLPPFFKFFKKLHKEDKEILLEYILRARGASTITLKKIINSPFFYNAIEIDKFLKEEL